MKQRFGDQLSSWAILSHQNDSLGVCKGQLDQMTFRAPFRFILSVNVYQTPVRTEQTDAGLQCLWRPSSFLPEFRTNWVKDIEVRKTENCNITTIIEKPYWGYKGNSNGFPDTNPQNKINLFIRFQVLLDHHRVSQLWVCCGHASLVTLQRGGAVRNICSLLSATPPED